MLKKTLYIINKKERRQLPLLFAEIILGAAFETIGISAIVPVVNLLVDPDAVYKEGIISRIYVLFGFSDIKTYFYALMGAVIVFFIIKNIYLFVMRYHQFYFINNGQRNLTKRLMVGCFSQPYLFFTKINPADLQRNITADVGKCFQTILNFLTVLTQGAIAVALVIFLIISDWQITVLILSIISVTLALFVSLSRKLTIKYGIIARNQGEKVIQWVNQGIGGIKEVKLFNKENFFLTKIDEAYSASSISECKQSVISTVPNLAMESVCIISIMVAIFTKIAANGDMTQFISVLAAFALAAIRLIPTIGNVSSSINRIMFNKASINGIYNELIELEKGNNNDGKINAEETERLDFKHDVEIRDVGFQYPDTDRMIIKNGNFVIKRGQSVAFIGPSGAGKTTMADLILGILEPTEGEIDVDGKNIRNNIKGWYKQIGYIPQNIYLMDDSIRNNIAFGIDEKDIDDNKVWNALKKAQLEEFVKNLPGGLDTNLGDRGIRCSGGQRQRLGIARALYEDPEFLILDEATSALDSDTENAIMEAIDGLKGEKTLLIIAHRLSTIKNCDIVFRIDSGSVRKED